MLKLVIVILLALSLVGLLFPIPGIRVINILLLVSFIFTLVSLFSRKNF